MKFIFLLRVKSFRGSLAKLSGEEEEDSTGYLSVFKDQLTSEYAKITSESANLGLAQMLYEQMKLNYSPVKPET